MSIKIELNEPQKQEDIEVMLKNENSSSGEIEDYRDLLNLPKVNGVTLLGNKTSSDLGLQPQGDYAFKSSIPTKVSQLTNDSGFLTKHQDISSLATKEELNQKQDVISDLSTIRSNASKGATAVQPSQLSTVAISGSYKDLKDKPTIPESGGGSSGTAIDAYTKSETDNLLSEKQDKGDYALKSSLPTKTSQLINDSGFLTQHQDISGKQDKLVAGDNITIVNNVISSIGGVSDAYTKTETDNLLSEKQDKGNYALKSEIPTNVSQLNNDKGYLTEHQDISGKQDKLIAGNNITIVGNIISATGEITPSNGSSSTKTVGQIFASLFPLEDAGLHLLDGSLISGDGIYKSFVDYIATLDLSSNYFMQETPESDWTQPVITSNGTIGGSSFAVSATQSHEGNPANKMFDNNTSGNWVSAGVEDDLILYNPTPIRITKLGMTNRNESPVRPIANGTIYGSNDGNVYTEITSFTNTVETQSGTWYVDLSNNANYYKYYKLSLVGVSMYCSLNAMAITAKLIGLTPEQNWQNFLQQNGVCGKFVYDPIVNTVRLPKLIGFIDGTNNSEALGDLSEIGVSNSSSVKFKGTKVYYYIVVATSTKTDIEVNIDNIVTDLSNKAEKEFAKNSSYLSKQYIDLTLGASGSTYIAPANGEFCINATMTVTNGGVIFRNTSNGYVSVRPRNAFAGGAISTHIKCKKGEIIELGYDGLSLSESWAYFRFYYAESEV